ncbi:MAG: hypothetical protein IT462_16400 [Planctomycetes bacterium]|nr:hypothetical protein [Planctomycetota bacterium]
MRRFAIFLIVAACSLAIAHVSRGQDPQPPKPAEDNAIVEVEPNDDEKTATQEIKAGTPCKGVFANKSDVDCFLLTSDEPVVINLTLTIQDNINARLLFLQATNKNIYTRNGPLRVLNLRLPSGKHALRLNNESNSEEVAWRVDTSIVQAGSDVEVEPNDKANLAQEIPIGVTIKGAISHSSQDHDYFAAKITEDGIYRLSFTPKLRPEDAGIEGVQLPEFNLRVSEKDSRREHYAYRADQVAPAYVFYPYFYKGEALIDVQCPPDVVGAGYDLLLETVSPKVWSDLEAAARAAIRRGEDWLLTAKFKEDTHECAARAFHLAALAEGEWGDRKAARDAKVDELLAWFDKAFTKETKGTWRGEEVYCLGGMYVHAMATLALAEAVAAGFEKARPLCSKGVRYLLAAQLSDERSENWGVIDPQSEHFGGWRYSGNSDDADLSVIGWCLVALYAADAAGVKEPGIAAAVRRAQTCVKLCKYKSEGFTYQPKSSGIGLIRQSIGALIYLLLGMDGEEMKSALRDIEMNQCAGTQSADSSHDCPYYYWYYATRATYLRGGAPWEAWRTVTMQQLTRTQLADGHWQNIRQEDPAGTRYATGMAVIILRLCLNKPPSYLRKEVKGF